MLKAIESGRITFPISPPALALAIASAQVQPISTELNMLWEQGMNTANLFKDTTPTAILVKEYAHRFRAEIWPGKRLTAIFYDPRSLEIGGRTRACLHAKCVVIDDEYLLVTSANWLSR